MLSVNIASQIIHGYGTFIVLFYVIHEYNSPDYPWMWHLLRSSMLTVNITIQIIHGYDTFFIVLFHAIHKYGTSGPWQQMLLLCAVNQNELDKAKDVLLQYEEELLQPSARTLRFLARSLERAGMPVSFDVPDFQPVCPYVWC